MGQRFSNQTVLITGASRGIGRAVALAFAAEGATTLINYRADETGARDTQQHILDQGGQAHLAQADIGNTGAVDSMVDIITAQIGSVDVLVNNAALTNKEAFFDLSLTDFDRLLEVNVRGLFYLSQRLAAGMRSKGGGAIIQVSSILAQHAMPNRVAYITTKSAVEGLTRAMALDLAPYGIRVNAVVPGVIETHMLLGTPPNLELKQKLAQNVPLKRLGQPHDLAESVLFLASPAAAYLTGVLLPVDGGLAVLEAGPY